MLGNTLSPGKRKYSDPVLVASFLGGGGGGEKMVLLGVLGGGGGVD